MKTRVIEKQIPALQTLRVRPDGYDMVFIKKGKIVFVKTVWLRNCQDSGVNFFLEREWNNHLFFPQHGPLTEYEAQMITSPLLLCLNISLFIKAAQTHGVLKNTLSLFICQTYLIVHISNAVTPTALSWQKCILQQDPTDIPNMNSYLKKPHEKSHCGPKKFWDITSGLNKMKNKRNNWKKLLQLYSWRAHLWALGWPLRAEEVKKNKE